MNIKIIFLMLVIGLTANLQAASDKIIGYFPYWCQYFQFYPKDIRYNLLTDIHYASISLSPDASLNWTDEGDSVNYNSLAELSRQNNVNLVVSVGGMDMDNSFIEIAASEELRKTFADNLVSWMDEHKATGVELDWQNLTTENAENFEALVVALKNTFGNKYSLSAILYPQTSLDAYSENALKALDYACVFTADEMTESEAVLKPNQSATSLLTALSSFASKGMNKEKLLPIIKFYGKTFSNAKGLGSEHSGIGSGNDGIVSYRDMMNLFDSPDYKVSFDEASKSEVAVSNMESIVFMGIPSVKAISSDVKNEGYAGVALYDVSQDFKEPIVSLMVTVGLELRPELDYKPSKKK